MASLKHSINFADATQLQAGGNGVWAIGSNQNIYRLDESGARFIQLPGALVSISVGSGGGVWGLDGSGKAYGFTARRLGAPVLNFDHQEATS